MTMYVPSSYMNVWLIIPSHVILIALAIVFSWFLTFFFNSLKTKSFNGYIVIDHPDSNIMDTHLPPNIISTLASFILKPGVLISILAYPQPLVLYYSDTILTYPQPLLISPWYPASCAKLNFSKVSFLNHKNWTRLQSVASYPSSEHAFLLVFH